MRNKNSIGADDSVGPYGRKQEDTTMDLREITDFNAPELDVYARLTENQLVNRADPANALFIAESPLVIGRALDAGCVPVSFLMERKHVEGKAAELLARCPADIPVYAAPLEVLEQLTGFKLTRGMLCAMRRPKLPTVEQVCAGARRVAVLENVMNPTNIGAIFRSAAALNMDAVLLSTQGSDPLYRRAVRVSMGTVFQVPWTYFPEDAAWPEGGMALLRRLGFQTAAMALRDDSLSIDDPRLLAEDKLAVVLGAGGSTKMVDIRRDDRIDRVFHPKYPTEYIQRQEQVAADLEKFAAFHREMLENLGE